MDASQVHVCNTVLAPDQDLYGQVAIKIVPAANLSLLAGVVQHRYANQLREGGQRFEHLTSLR